MNNKCPVCEKSGIPDYTMTPVVCPQCNTDLKPFLLLQSLAVRKINKFVKLGLIGLSIILFIFVILYIEQRIINKQVINHNSQTLSELQDSLKKMHEIRTGEPSKKPTDNTVKEGKITFVYTVKKGDNTSKIAQCFYNDWKLYSKIESDNDLHYPYILRIGQTLRIELNQQQWK